MKKSFLTVVLIVSLSLTTFSFSTHHSSTKIKDITIKGYITNVYSLTAFEIDDYRATVDRSTDVELENVDEKVIKFDPAVHLKVGTFIKIKGKVNSETLEVAVKEIRVDVKQYRSFSKTVILDTAPTGLSKNEGGNWTGSVLADARRIMITDSTKVLFRLNKSEEREAKEAKKKKEAEEKAKIEQQKIDEESKKAEIEKIKKESKKAEGDLENKSDDDDDGFEEEDDIRELSIGSGILNSLDQIGPGVYMTYKGIEDINGAVIASDVVFVKNEKTKQEREMWKDLRLKEKNAKRATSFGSLKVGDTKYEVLPEKEIQEYINRLGNSLIPDYQKDLPDDDENKIPFRFVVVHEKGFNAAAYPTGTVVVHDDVFGYLENEAQLAFLLSHEISHATQEHSLRAALKDKGKKRGILIGKIFASVMGYGLLMNALTLTEAAMKNGYARNQENQADRIGMSNMFVRGYDPREAPRTWKVLSLREGNDSTNFFWSAHASNAERRSFLMLTLRNTYGGTDFSALKKDSDEFHQISTTINLKYGKKKKNG